MIPKEILKKIKKLEIQTKGIVNTLFGGEYQSAFKGRGMEFSEVRAYTYGDDIRQIDWNVTARTGDPFIKVFEEEREQTLMLCIDISQSGTFGSRSQSKMDLAIELCAVLAFSAISAVSPSRISPTRMTSGSCRSRARIPLAKLMLAASLICV